jgi:type IV pilus assembly protein PilW
MKTTAQRNHRASAERFRERGLSMVELMVAMTIGAVLLVGATQVYMSSQKSYGVNETVARLQENARYAMSVLEPDIRMSNYWGLLKVDAIAGQVAQTLPPGAVAAGADANFCGNNFAIDLSTNLQGDNDTYVLSATRTANCDSLPDITSGVPWATTPVTTADTLTVRRSSALPLAVPGGALANTLQICSSRVSGLLVSDGSGCGVALPPAVQLTNLIVNAYYVDQNSTQQAGLPSLRRKTLTSVGGKVVFRDQEVMAGVEDMQIQFGIDPTGVTGVAQSYVDPNAVPALSQIVAVRVWLLVRGDQPETGFTDNNIYQYGDRLQANGVTGDLNAAGSAGLAYQPSLNANAGFNGPQHVRRILISRTIQIRNAMGT